jgi:hypothetical protein
MTCCDADTSKIGVNFRRLLAGEDVQRPLVWLYGAVPSFAVQNLGYEAMRR